MPHHLVCVEKFTLPYLTLPRAGPSQRLPTKIEVWAPEGSEVTVGDPRISSPRRCEGEAEEEHLVRLVLAGCAAGAASNDAHLCRVPVVCAALDSALHSAILCISTPAGI